MASADVMMCDETIQLFHDLHLGMEHRVRAGPGPNGFGGAPLTEFAQQPFSPPQAPLAPPAARAQAAGSTPPRPVWSGVQQPLHAQPVQLQLLQVQQLQLQQMQSPLAPSPQPAVVRPPSPDSRYLITNWASVDEVEEELSYMMFEQASIDDGPQHSRQNCSYIS
ncbi:hypothetical protein T492DRAFT_999003 [Pavlovales sp. CCMP2436]|nr:hypothetical protein T492DRAFT_999003 [Pavlovales sp. CCMP2436]